MSPFDPEPIEPTLSMEEAAEACGVRWRTIRHARRTGRLKGFTADGDGGWRVPITELVACGLLARAVPPPEGTLYDATETQRRLEESRRMHRQTTNAAVAAEHRVEVAEAVSDERRRFIDDLLRILELVLCGHASLTDRENH